MVATTAARRAALAAALMLCGLLSACTTSQDARPGPTEPAASPSGTPRPAPQPDAEPAITLTVVGDIMLDRGVAAAHRDPTATLAALRPLLRRADITVGNLESTLSTDGAPTQGDDSFAASPSVLDGLEAAGFDALSLANNHLGDYGDRALVKTVAAFDGSGITPFGAGPDLATAIRPAIIERDGMRVGFLGFNAIGETPMAGPRTPGALSVRMPPRTGPLNSGDLARVLRAVRRLAERVDAVVVVPHWGQQYTHVAEPVQRRVAHRLVDAGADLVVGGHPHWVQGLERYRGVVIAHSLGNLVFDMDFMEQTMEGVALTATIRAGRVVGVRLTPYRLDSSFTPRPLRGAAAKAVLDDVHENSWSGR
jgi:poly-gamma-glutamate capsule biosynthesis protein CapA/YwtB (metallophosphatase superfamily)